MALLLYRCTCTCTPVYTLDTIHIYIYIYIYMYRERERERERDDEFQDFPHGKVKVLGSLSEIGRGAGTEDIGNLRKGKTGAEESGF